MIYNIKRIFLRIYLPVILSISLVAVIFVSTFIVNAVKISNETNFTFSSPTVIIDAGHGGFDGGAVVNKISEKDINLAIANTLSDMLKLSGINVIQTRSTDTSVESDSSLSISSRKKSDMRNRLALANSNPDAILVSIHLNKFSSSSAKGAQIFYGIKSEKSNLLAEEIRASIVQNIQPDNKRSLKKGTSDTYLLKFCEIPAVIVECGFMSNEQEFTKLLNKDYQKEMAFAICNGIISYLS